MLRKHVLAVCALTLLSGCSVGMAISGRPAPDLSAVKREAYRSDIEMRLGPPIRASLDGRGRSVAVYRYEIGNEPSAGRAIGHAVMDLLTFGAWEIVGTPVEGVQGDAYDLTVTYDEQDKVAAVSSHKVSSGL